MPGHEDFEKHGEREGKPKTTPDECDDCVYTELAVALPGHWDTVLDAKQAYDILRDSAIKGAWKKMFDDFQCPPHGDPELPCKFVHACGNKITFLWGVADLKPTPKDKVPRWVAAVIVGRKLKCVQEASKDVDPEIPKPEGEKGKDGEKEAPKTETPPKK